MHILTLHLTQPHVHTDLVYARISPSIHLPSLLNPFHDHRGLEANPSLCGTGGREIRRWFIVPNPPELDTFVLCRVTTFEDVHQQQFAEIISLIYFGWNGPFSSTPSEKSQVVPLWNSHFGVKWRSYVVSRKKKNGSTDRFETVAN